MHLPVISNLEDVAARQLCAGCGACAGLEPDRIEMVDVEGHGRRPRYRGPAPRDDRRSNAMQACPGLRVEHHFDRHDPRFIEELIPGWGPVLEIWEGWAVDPEIRFRGSSGGAATALALAALERGRVHGVLHVAARRDAPLLNRTVLSTSRASLVAATGSRYAPASPADGLHRIAAAPGPCAFIGKPCDVAAAARARDLDHDLDRRLLFTIGIFCAGTPTTRATRSLLRTLGVDHPEDVVDLRYRGHGWPGRLSVTVRTAQGRETRELDYEDAWGQLTNDKPWRCHVCADHTGELADLAVGDPWYRPVEPGDPGRSLIVVRTERGRAALRRAIDDGYLQAERRPPSVLPDSQPNLLRGRGAVWARRLACRLTGVPVPRYRGFPMFRHWLRTLSGEEKLRSFLGTFRRIAHRGLRRSVLLDPMPAPAPPAAAEPLRRAA